MICFTTTTRWDELDVNPVFKTCLNIIVNKLVKSESVNGKSSYHIMSLPIVDIKPIDISYTIPPLQEYEFPTSFTSTERRYVDHFCTQFGLKTKRRRYVWPPLVSLNDNDRQLIPYPIHRTAMARIDGIDGIDGMTAYKRSSTIIAIDGRVVRFVGLHAEYHQNSVTALPGVR